MNLQEAAAEKEGPQVIVFAQEEFERVYVDGIDIGATRSLLVMVMFVNVAVDAFNVQEPVQNGVEKVVHDKERYERYSCIGESDFFPIPQNVWFKVGVPQVKINKGCRRCLTDSNK
jgi:hypothetical protein